MMASRRIIWRHIPALLRFESASFLVQSWWCDLMSLSSHFDATKYKSILSPIPVEQKDRSFLSLRLVCSILYDWSNNVELSMHGNGNFVLFANFCWSRSGEKLMRTHFCFDLLTFIFLRVLASQFHNHKQLLLVQILWCRYSACSRDS